MCMWFVVGVCVSAIFVFVDFCLRACLSNIVGWCLGVDFIFFFHPCAYICVCFICADMRLAMLNPATRAFISATNADQALLGKDLGFPKELLEKYIE